LKIYYVPNNIRFARESHFLFPGRRTAPPLLHVPGREGDPKHIPQNNKTGFEFENVIPAVLKFLDAFS
jgi:hypothetical protein